MKNYIIILAIAAGLTGLLAGCQSTQGSKEEYFGYSTPRRVKEVEKTVIIKERVYKTQNDEDAKSSWRNPLKTETDEGDEAEYSDNESETRVVYYNRYSSPQYVPVIVPWWDYWYYDDWYWSRPGFYMSYRYGHPWFYDWYCPWYTYSPYYGHNWYPGWYYYNNHHWWQHHEDYAYSSYRQRGPERGTRDFGPHRGSYNQSGSSETNYSTPRSSYAPSATSRSGSNQGTVTPRSGYAPRGKGGSKSSGDNPASTPRSGYSPKSGGDNQGNNNPASSTPRSGYSPQGGSSKGSSSGSGSTNSTPSKSSGGTPRSSYSPVPSSSSGSSGSSGGRSSGGSSAPSGGGSRSGSSSGSGGSGPRGSR